MGRKVVYPRLYDKDWLYRKYWLEKNSQREIAEELGCSQSSVSLALKKLGISSRNPKQVWKDYKHPFKGKKRDKLKDALAQIDNIKRKGYYHPELWNREWLYNKYWREKLSLQDIAKLLGCDYRAVHRAFKRFGIPRRSREEATKIALNRPEVKEKLKRHIRSLLSTQEKKMEWLMHILKNVGTNKGPTKPERKLMEILDKAFPGEWIYNGNCEAGIMIGGLIPDFVNVNGKKIVIEVFGEYWHKRDNIPYFQTAEGRMHIFRRYGWEAIIFWENEVYDEEHVISKVKEVLKNWEMRCNAVGR